MIGEIATFTYKTGNTYSRERDCTETTQTKFLVYLDLLYIIGIKVSSNVIL